MIGTLSAFTVFRVSYVRCISADARFADARFASFCLAEIIIVT